MEQGLGSDSVDKSRVLDVKPLRCLVPVFPNSEGISSISTPQPTPFVCVAPSGPFPSGVQPFYPFMAPNASHHATQNHHQSNFGFNSGSIPAPVPLNSFRSPTSHANGSTSGRGRPRKGSKTTIPEYDDSPSQNDFYAGMDADDDEEGSHSGRKRGRMRKKWAANGKEIDVEPLLNTFLTSFKLKEFDDFRRTNGDNETVKTILLVFDLLRRKLTQLEESRDLAPGIARRPDLKAANLLMTKGVRTNNLKRVGHVPGVEVGDIFFFRMELCVVGLHAPSMAGIDYMSVRISSDEEPVAVSIVSSGGYDDQGDDSDVLIYSGQGGVQRRDGQMFDQKLERGNLALEKSLHRANDVRVVRGIKDNSGPNSRIYIYDGVYRIQESWAEKNKSGCNVFKYKLVRVPGQPEAFSMWKSIQGWKDGNAPRTGVILPDLTSGADSYPVALVNDVDDEKGPAHFTYVSRLKYSQPFPSSKPSPGCHCSGGCQPGDANCPCNQLNEGFVPYLSLGVLAANTNLIHECGLTCQCPLTCRSRTSQGGIKVRLEVFKTKDRGWGLRSWEPIRAGGFICEYAGDIIKTVESGNEYDDDYIFDATRFYEPLEPVHDPNETKKSPFPLVISAKYNGNIARFMNHSCSPNVYWVPVLRENDGDAYLHIAFFAIRHIPPMQELTFNYGIIQREEGEKRKKKCLCGSVKCKGYFY